MYVIRMWFLHLCGFVLAVCGPPHLPAGALIYLVREPGRMERQQDGLEAVCLRGDLPHHASPLPCLLDRSKVKGNKLRNEHQRLFFFLTDSHESR